MTSNLGELFTFPGEFADMDRWHEQVAGIRRDSPVLRVDLEGSRHIGR